MNNQKYILALTILSASFNAFPSENWNMYFEKTRVCMDNSGYINIHFKNKPINAHKYKVGDTMVAKGGTAILCPIRTVTSEVKIRIEGWSENTSHFYKFSVFGPAIK